KESKGKDISTGSGPVSTGLGVSTGSGLVSIGLGVSTGSGPVSTGLGVSTGSGPVSSARSQREGKAQMVEEDVHATQRTKEQIQQEEAGLAEAIRLQTLEEEE
ncbi:hypothetical protein Tco_0549734, partial [Tanacetum coccineum]